MYPAGDYSQLYDSTGSRVYPNLINIQQLPVVPGDNLANKICGVCGDKAKSLHFGGMACDSCKAFFRRSVQNDAYKHFRCAYDGRCHITMNSRKSCQNCRFSKCVDIGMEKSWVMTEEERLQQSKLRQEKKRQKQDEDVKRRHSQDAKLRPHQPRIEDRHLYLSDHDVTDIELLLDTFYETYQTSPPPVDVQPETMSCKLRVVNVFVNTISRVVQYVSNLPRFQRIANCDKPILLKHGVLAMTILRGTMVYDTSSSFFSLKTGDRVDSGASISFDEMKSILTDDLYQDHFKFIKAMKALQLNEATLMILQMVVLFSSDRMGLTDIEPISKEQDFYTSLIHKYMLWWYGEENTKLLYPKMLHRLADLRTLTEAHSDHTVHIPDPDFVKVVESFSKIDLNPYPYWSGFGGSEGEQEEAYRGAMASPTTAQQQQHRHNSHHSNGDGMSGSDIPRAVSSAAAAPCPSGVRAGGDATVRAVSVHIKPTSVLQQFQPSVNDGQSNPVRHVHHVPYAGYVYVSSTRGAAADRHVHPDSTSQLYQTAEYGTYQPDTYTAKSWSPTEYSGDGCGARQEGNMLNWSVESRQQHLQQHGEQQQQPRQPPVAFANVQDFSDFQAILGMEQRNRNCSSEGLQPVQPQQTAPRCYIKSESTSAGCGRQVLKPPEPLQLRLKSEETAAGNGTLQSPAVPPENYQHHQQQQVELTAAGSFPPAAGQQLPNEPASVYQAEPQSSVPPPPQYMQYPTQPPPYPDMGW